MRRLLSLAGMTGYKGSVLDGMDTQHVAFCCIERCNPQPTTMADGVVKFFYVRKKWEWRYLCKKNVAKKD